MSYTVTKRVQEGRRQADAKAYEEIEDLKRARFLESLDCAQFEVSDWEARFIDTYLSRISSTGQGFQEITFSPKQREVIDLMREKYEPRLPAPLSAPRDTATNDRGAIRRTGESTSAHDSKGGKP